MRKSTVSAPPAAVVTSAKPANGERNTPSLIKVKSGLWAPNKGVIRHWRSSPLAATAGAAAPIHRSQHNTQPQTKRRSAVGMSMAATVKLPPAAMDT